MRHLCMGDLEDRLRRAQSGRGGTAADWESRRAELAARKAATMADPVQSFYLRHGRPPGHAEPEPGPAAADGDEPGPA
jgi:hypothetical protein